MFTENQFVIHIQNEVKNFTSSQILATGNEIKFSKIHLIVKAFTDILFLTIKFLTNRTKKYNIIYTGVGLCHEQNGKYTDRILKPILLKNVIYINKDKDVIIEEINGIKTYNIGGVVKLIYLFRKLLGLKTLAMYKSYKIVNMFILGKANNPDVYSFLFYNLNGLSLMFLKHRHTFTLIEVQHGTIINFPPYSRPSDFKCADVFYVKNQATIDFLKKKINKNFPDVEYKQLPYPALNTTYTYGVFILYASSIEFNGIHPLFMEYLDQLKESENVTVFIRLHPREKHKLDIFQNQIEHVKAKVHFDNSENWLEANKITNLIVVSPWSSVIEDAADNNYKTIIIDKLGNCRFKGIVDNSKVFFVDNLTTFLKVLNNGI